MTIAPTRRKAAGIETRRQLRGGDVGAIAHLHGRVYAREHRLGPLFEADVARGLSDAVEAGWPARGGLWLVEHEGHAAGSIGWTEEEGGSARLRWFLLEPQLRGQGLGRHLVDEVVAEIEDAGRDPIRLDTFSELRAAAHLYRSLGFEVVDSRPFARWGRPLTLQRFERRLPPAAA